MTDALLRRALCIACATLGLPAVASADGHKRFTDRGGVIHTFAPPGYRAATAGVVVYLHGYRTTVDRSWTDDQLSQQFVRSGQNALFVAPAAPSADGQRANWPSLSALLRAVQRRVRVPRGPIVLVAHSGGGLTVGRWLMAGRPEVARVLLLDGFYGYSAQFQRWIEADARGRRLLLVVRDTAERAEAFARRLPRLLARRPRVPDVHREFTRRERRARVLLVRSQYGHMELVREGRALPVLLRLTPLRRVLGSRPAARTRR